MPFECLILLNNKKYLVKNKFFKNAKISSDYKKYKKTKIHPIQLRPMRKAISTMFCGIFAS